LEESPRTKTHSATGIRACTPAKAEELAGDPTKPRCTAPTNCPVGSTSKEAHALQRLDHLRPLAERVAAHVLARDLGGAAGADPAEHLA
jgi:hypothetical protein